MYCGQLTEIPKQLELIPASNDGKGDNFRNEPLDEADEDILSMSVLSKIAPPKFKIGDRVWAQLTADELVAQLAEAIDDPLYLDGCLSVVIVGLCQTVEGTHYHIGYWDEFTNEVSTLYETYREFELFLEHPGPVRPKVVLKVVK